MAPLEDALRSMYDLRAQSKASWNQLYAGFCLEAEKRTNTNLTHLWCHVRKPNLGHIGERRVRLNHCANSAEQTTEQTTVK